MLSKTFLKNVETIHNDTQSGASKIAIDCLNTLKYECIRLNSVLNESILKTAIQLLLDTHPMATIENALLPVYIRLIDLINSGGIQSEGSIEMIFATRKEQMRVGEQNTIKTLSKELEDKQSILTFTHSSTVLNSLLQLAKEGYTNKTIYILESRPLREGERTAYTLANAGYEEVNLGIDFALNDFANLAEVTVMGADMIQNTGFILNKLGSATIAKMFNDLSKEVIIGASLAKICLLGIINEKKVRNLVIPHRNPKEVSSINHPNLKVWNRYFEKVDLELVSTLIMDNYRFTAPISDRLTEFILKNPLFSSQLKVLRNLWEKADYTFV
ncbi:MAG: hypothetical protein ACTSW1_11035 [Candidatus Hodarchaeales archaeon]